MRVICVDASDRHGVKTPSYIIEGNEYNVSDCNCGCGLYMLLDFGNNAAEKDRFAPISNIDETTFERNYQKELV